MENCLMCIKIANKQLKNQLYLLTSEYIFIHSYINNLINDLNYIRRNHVVLYTELLI